MIKGFLFILLLSWSSFSIAEEEDFYNEIDEIQTILEDDGNQNNDFLVELKKLGHNNLGLASLKDPRVKGLIAKQFDESNVSLLSLDDKRKIFNAQFKDSTINEVLDKFPKLKDVIIDVITDKNTMLGLISIVQKHESLNLIYILVSMIIINFILKKIFASSPNFLFRFIQRIIINIFTSLLVITTLFFLYKKELTPLVKVVTSHFKL